MCEVTPAQLEEYMIKVIENHAARVARWGLGSKAEVKSGTLAGMWRAWLTSLQYNNIHPNRAI